MKTKKAFIKKINWAFASIISLLGFAGCMKVGTEEHIILMYGAPHSEYNVKGVVVSEATGQPIKGIRVVVPRVEHHQRPTSGFIPDQRVITREVRDTIYTEENGVFEYKYYGIQSNDSTNIIMKFEDIAENFKADSAKITFFQSDLKGSEGWFQGSASKEINIKLNNKDSE